MRVLRDLRAFTKLLILLELKSQPRTKMHEIAKRLDVTTQAISEYIKLMLHEKLLVKINGEYKLTREGVEFLHKNISELKEFLDASIEGLDIINVCTALAAQNLKKGEAVNLSMQNGILYATNKKVPKSKSTSSGVILYDANKGDDVAVVNLSGILEYDFGNLTILTLPSAQEGGSQRISLKRFKSYLSKTKPDRLAVYDLIGFNLLAKIGKSPDIEFSALPASIEATQKGFNVMLLTSTETLSDIISQLENVNSQTKSIVQYSVVSWKKTLE
ncbi:MAG: winged helix-turn-helix transcriptional regulator [Thermoplasmata archaeon]|nr:winged helix-turn-helix transcriptional regulator [Thermoplasmata archaeon]